MKAKYLFAAVVAAFTMGSACISCDVDQDPDTFLSDIKVSQSYVAVDTEGGSTSITVNTSSAWYIDESIPSWLTVSPMKGEAGTFSLDFTADVATSTRTGEVLLYLADSTTVQHINVIQYAEESEPVVLSISEALSIIESGKQTESTVRVKGIVCRIQEISMQYGNATYFLSDDGTFKDGTWLEIYRGGWTNGSKFTSGDEFAMGDELVVAGVLINYSGTPEISQGSEVISVKKSLVKIEEGGTNAFDANGGDFLVRLSVSGDGPSVSIADDAKSWLGISSIEKTDSTTNFAFHVAANGAESARTATIEFSSSNGSATSIVSATVSQQGLMGTLTNPFTVEQAIAYCQTLTAASANDFYVKGKVSKVVYTFNADKKTGTFWISADGVFNDDKSKDFEAYGVYWFGNQAWVEGNAQVSVGDEVVICGKLTNYNGTSETSSKNAYVYSVNGVSTDANGLGSAVSPFNVAGAKAAIDGGVADSVYVQGIVSKVVYPFSASYGTGTFWISDDGTYAGSDDNKTPGATDFEAYGVYWLGNKAWTEDDAQIEKGDKVVLRGTVTKYGSTYETSSKKAYVYSVEK